MGSIALALLKRPSARDKQIKIGPSDASDPCSLCLAEKLYHFYHKTPVTEQQRTYWLGARIGTAIHAELEREARKVKGLVPEQKIDVIKLAGYGMLRGSADLYDSNTLSLHDFKTTDRDKLKKLKQAEVFWDRKKPPVTLEDSIYKLDAYKAQTHLYAYGLHQKGCKVTRIVIDFICRDGKTDSDIWDMEFPYDERYAEAVIARLTAIWDAIRSGATLDTFTSHRLCYYCTTTRK